MISRAEKNCNPGNIRKSTDLFNGEVRPSQDKEFKQFRDMDYGFRAMWSVLKSYYYRHGLYSIQEIINRWAPLKDRNPTEAYIDFVAKQSGYFRKEWEASCHRGFDMIFRR